MPDDILTLAVTVAQSEVANINITRGVSNLLEPTQSSNNTFPKVMTTLVPTQVIEGVLPKITNTLVPGQTIVSSIKMSEVSHTLTPIQVIISNIKMSTVESKLVPIQTIGTDSSILSNSSYFTLTTTLGMTISNGGTFGINVTTQLIPVQGINGYVYPTITKSGVTYKTDQIYD